MSQPLRPIGLFLFCALAAVVPAYALEICLSDHVKASLPVRAAFLAELQVLIPKAKIGFDLQNCEVRLRILNEMAGEPDVLGRAPKNGNRIEGDLDIFVSAIVRFLGERRSATVLGRALARVAAHEVGHYFAQSVDHPGPGVMHSHLTASQLTSEDSLRYMLRIGRTGSSD